jgi:hypothetical protein
VVGGRLWLAVLFPFALVTHANGEPVLLIPLAAGGRELAKCSRGISEITGDCLRVVIRPWLAEKLRIGDGTLVRVDNRNGKFNVAPL